MTHEGMAFVLRSVGRILLVAGVVLALMVVGIGTMEGPFGSRPSDNRVIVVLVAAGGVFFYHFALAMLCFGVSTVIQSMASASAERQTALSEGEERSAVVCPQCHAVYATKSDASSCGKSGTLSQGH